MNKDRLVIETDTPYFDEKQVTVSDAAVGTVRKIGMTIDELVRCAT